KQFEVSCCTCSAHSGIRSAADVNARLPERRNAGTANVRRFGIGIAVFSAWAALMACGGGFDGTTLRPSGIRLVTGPLRPPAPRLFQHQPVALELVGATIDTRADEPLIAFSSGTPVSPSENGVMGVTVRLAIPDNHAVALFLQAPVEGPGGVGQLVATL